MVTHDESVKAKRGFAAMDPEKRREIARKGGNAPHTTRGFAAMDKEEQRKIASKGGKAYHKKRGFQAMDPEKQREIAKKGGSALHESRIKDDTEQVSDNENVLLSDIEHKK